jgi:phosphomannomutase
MFQLYSMNIFRSYDIRGIYGKDLNEDIMKRIGAAFAKVSSSTIVIASDGRASSLPLKKAFIDGFGREIIDLGTVPLGVGMFYALKKYDYAYITASHLGKEWNGVKFFHKSGIGFLEAENKKIEEIFRSVKLSGPGKVRKENTKKIVDEYIEFCVSRAKPRRKIDVVVDCGNGMASVAAKQLFARAGYNVKALFDVVDGAFPGRGPDPAENELKELKKKTLSADLGIAYDGDGDRMVLVDNTGRKLSPEQTSFLILLEAVKHPGPIVANVECTRLIDDIAKRFNKKVIRVPVGHTFLMEAVQKEKACFGIEVSGHYALPYMAPFDDSLMVSLFAASVLSAQDRKLSDIVGSMKIYPFERLNFNCPDEKKFSVVDNLKKRFVKEYSNVTTLDGVRVDFPDGWILLRASNTAPLIRLTVEANDKKSFDILRKKFALILREEISRQEIV